MSEARLPDRVPTDVAIAVAWLGLAVVTALLGASVPRFVRAPVLVGFGVLVPGYLVMLALFPRDGSISGLARAVLSVAASPAILVLIGVVFDHVWRIDAVTMAVGIAAVSVFLAALAEYRRRLQPEGDRARPLSDATDWAGTLRRDLEPPGDLRRSTLLPVASAALVFVLAVALVVGTPAPGQQFTEFYVLGTDGTVDGLTVGSGNATQPAPVVTLSIHNHEHADETYGVQVQAVGETPGDVAVVRTIDGISLAHDERWNETMDVSAFEDGGYARVEFLLFREAPPGEPVAPDDAYRSVDLTV